MGLKRLKAGDLEAIYQVPITWWYEQAKAGLIPHIRVGRYIRFDLEEVEGWLRQRGSLKTKELRKRGP